MDPREITRTAATLPERYADRVTPQTAGHLRGFASAGEFVELLELLPVALRNNGATITAAEHDELLALLVACGLPTASLSGIAVSG